ncbi:cytochrome P450, partial [Paxillus ammoniavirescens]
MSFTATLSTLSQVANTISAAPGSEASSFDQKLYDLPLKDETVTYDEWAKKYGDLVYANVMGHRLLFVNSPQVAIDLFEKRAVNYSDRNELPMINDLMGWNWSFGHMSYGERWKKHRKMFERLFRPAVAPTYWPLQGKEAHTLLRNLLDSPRGLIEHLRHNAAAVIMNVIYGIEIAPKDDWYVEIAEQALDGVATAVTAG